MEDNFKDVNIQFKVSNPLPRVNVKSAAEVAEKITKTFQEKKNIFDVIIIVMKRILAFIFLRVIYKYVSPSSWQQKRSFSFFPFLFFQQNLWYERVLKNKK